MPYDCTEFSSLSSQSANRSSDSSGLVGQSHSKGRPELLEVASVVQVIALSASSAELALNIQRRCPFLEAWPYWRNGGGPRGQYWSIS
jgi:hypothetical protein